MNKPVTQMHLTPGTDDIGILIVDDDERNLFAMQRVLENLGDIVLARSGEEALRCVLDRDFAVILMDVLMPEMDGYETASMIRARSASRNIPIIFLTAINKDDSHIIRGYSTGAVDYILKPVDPLIARSKVAVFVELFAMTQEIRRKAEQEQRLLQENLRIHAEKIEAEQALRRAEERQAMIIRSLPLALYAIDLASGQRHFVDDSVVPISGYERASFVEDPALWRSRIHPEDRDRVVAALDSIIEAESLCIEYRWQSADGTYAYLLDQAVLKRDAHGRPTEIFGTWWNVSDRKRMEQQLLLAQKMDALGKLTGGVAHDFNNMLTVVIGSLDRIRSSVENDEKVQRRVDMALDAATRCAGLTKHLLAFARRQPLQPQTTDLNSLLFSLSEMMNRLLGDAIELEIRRDHDLWPVLVDPSQAESMLINLAVNARDAMLDGGRLTFATANLTVVPNSAENEAGIPPGEFVLITVSDTGRGIPPDLIGRVFEPFFTTKEGDGGTGLGLSILHGFVSQSAGHVRVKSEVGAGTTFSVYLPRSATMATRVEQARAPAAIRHSSAKEVVLAVEDDPAVRQVAVGILEEFGYSILEAENGPAALEILNRGENVDLLFTDFSMPGGLNGQELAREAMRRRPGLKVLLTSAFSDLIDSETNEAAGVRFIAKPYRDRDLAMSVRSFLDCPSDAARN